MGWSPLPQILLYPPSYAYSINTNRQTLGYIARVVLFDRHCQLHSHLPSHQLTLCLHIKSTYNPTVCLCTSMCPQMFVSWMPHHCVSSTVCKEKYRWDTKGTWPSGIQDCKLLLCAFTGRSWFSGQVVCQLNPTPALRLYKWKILSDANFTLRVRICETPQNLVRRQDCASLFWCASQSGVISVL